MSIARGYGRLLFSPSVSLLTVTARSLGSLSARLGLSLSHRGQTSTRSMLHPSSIPLFTVCYATSDNFTNRPTSNPDRIMDELLLSSNLRRVDDVAGEVTKQRARQVVLKEKPTTPYIVLPNEEKLQGLIHKPRYALDLGGTLCKLVYTTVCHEEDGDQPEVLLNFQKFTDIEHCIAYLLEVWTERHPDDVIHCTGGGSFKYAELLTKELGIQVSRCDEMTSLINGCDFLLKNNEDESFTYHHEAVGLEKYQYKPIAADSVYPFLLVNIGTGISILKVTSPSSFERVGGSSMGGGTFIGLGQLLTQCEDFDELLKLAEKGDHRKVDTLVGDIYGGCYDHLNLAADLIAGSFGKCNKEKCKSEGPCKADYAKSLLLMISNNIGQMAMLYGNRSDLKRIYFGGFFIRQHPITMRTLTYAINFWSKGECEALFMKHEGYLGAVGSFLNSDLGPTPNEKLIDGEAF